MFVCELQERLLVSSAISYKSAGVTPTYASPSERHCVETGMTQKAACGRTMPVADTVGVGCASVGISSACGVFAAMFAAIAGARPTTPVRR